MTLEGMHQPRPGGAERPRVVIIGAGFAGFHCARALDRRLAATADLVLVNPVDHMVYTALLPDVVGGLLDPRWIATSLAASLPFTKVLVGTVTATRVRTRAPCVGLTVAKSYSNGIAWC
jgi:NADH dehydrogenase